MMPLPALRTAAEPDALPRAGATRAADASDFAALLGDALAPDAAARPAARGLPKGKGLPDGAAAKPPQAAAEKPPDEDPRAKETSLDVLMAMLPAGLAPVRTAGSHVKNTAGDDEKPANGDAKAVVTDPGALPVPPVPLPPAAAPDAALSPETISPRGSADGSTAARGVAQALSGSPAKPDAADGSPSGEIAPQATLPPGDNPSPKPGGTHVPQPAPAAADGAISFTTPPPPGSAVPAASPAPTADINARLGTPEWQQSVSQHITLFTRQGQQRAELTLHPQDLGQITISMRLDDNQAQLQMLAGHGHVRAALEAALPQLRTSLADSGIQLAQSFIGSDASPGQQQADRQPPPALPHPEGSPQAADNKGSAAAPASLLARARGNGAVDTFA